MSCGAQQLGGRDGAFAMTRSDLAKFEAADRLFPGKASIRAEDVHALDGALCTPKTQDGLLSAGGTDCHDLGEGVTTPPRVDPGHAISGWKLDPVDTPPLWQLSWLPSATTSAYPNKNPNTNPNPNPNPRCLYLRQRLRRHRVP